MTVMYHGIDLSTLAAMLNTGVDDAGARIEPFVDHDGQWPLRCCLSDSQVGDRLAIVGFTPFSWVSPYRETGPVVVHVERCEGHRGRFPSQFESRDQVVRAFGDADGRTNTQVYDRNRLVRAGDGLEATIEDALADPRVREVHVHNVISQCYNFAASRR